MTDHNPFEDWTKPDEKANRVREARPLNTSEIAALLDAICRRPLEQRICKGHNLKPATQKKLTRLGGERRLVYALLLY